MKDFIDQTDNAMMAFAIITLPLMPAAILAFLLEHFTGVPFQVGFGVIFFAGICIYSYFTRQKEERR